MKSQRPRWNFALLIFCIGSLALGATSPLQATQPSTALNVVDSPPNAIDISADRLEINIKDQSALLSGHVILSQEKMWKVQCSTLEARYEQTSSQIRWARGSGDVVAEVKGMHIRSTNFEINIPQKTIWLRGKVRLIRNQSWLKAEEAEINLSTGNITISHAKASLPIDLELKAFPTSP